MAIAKKRDTSPYVHQRKKADVKINVYEKIPWTEKQLEFIRLLQSKQTKVCFLKGPAGTSKSCISVYCALKALEEKKVSDIVYVRTMIESASAKLGFLPGVLEEKIRWSLMPLLDKLDELLSAEHKKTLLGLGLVEGIPVNHLRGAHFAGKYIIVDEAQNLTVPELTTVMTRIGEYCKVIVCGDPMQSDLGGGVSAFSKFYDAFNTEESQEQGIETFSFGKEDIVRSKILKYIVEVIEEKI